MPKIEGYKDNPRKNHWRSWQWNRIVQRLAALGIKTRDAIVLYLAAKDDADRVEALRRGFSFNNLIAVDNSKAVVAKLRAEGKTAVCCDIAEAVLAWPEANVVVADFTSGLEAKVIHFLQKITSADGVRVLSINLQRGREKGLGAAIDSIGARGYVCNRAKTAVMLMSQLFDHPLGALELMNPLYHSYKSDIGNLYFDSSIMTHFGLSGLGISARSNVIRKIAAAKAIRTQRLNGTLRRDA